MSLTVMTYVGCDGARMRSRPVPRSLDVHAELRGERSEPCRSAACPTPAIILQVCPLTPVRLTIIGIADASQCLHSVTVLEGSTEVLVRALVGQDTRPGRSDEFNYIVRRLLWVAEVGLDRPLGARLLTTDASLPATGVGNTRIHPHECLAHGSHTSDSPSSHTGSVTMQVSHRNQPKEIQS